MILKQSTAVSVRLGPFVALADGVTPQTGLTPVVEVSKGNGAFAARNSASAVTHDADGWYAIPLDATDTGTVGPISIKSDDPATYLPVWRDFFVVPAELYDAIWAGNAVDGTVTLVQAIRAILATAVGKLSGGGTTAIAIRDTADTKDRVTATVDSNGNRTTITLNLT